MGGLMFTGAGKLSSTSIVCSFPPNVPDAAGWENPSFAAATYVFMWAVLSGGTCHCLLPAIKGPGEWFLAAAMSSQVCVWPPAPSAALGRQVQPLPHSEYKIKMDTFSNDI